MKSLSARDVRFIVASIGTCLALGHWLVALPFLPAVYLGAGAAFMTDQLLGAATRRVQDRRARRDPLASWHRR